MRFEKLVKLKKSAELGKTASGVIHDLVGPLTVVSLSLDDIVKKSRHKVSCRNDIHESLSRAVDATKRMQDYIVFFRQQLNETNHKKIWFDPCNELQRAIKVLEARCNQKNIRLIYKYETKGKIYGSPIGFYQISYNLITNALDAYLPNRDPSLLAIIELTLKNINADLLFVIKDNGVGISKETVTKIFEPFFTTKDSQTNLGIGLTVCKNTIEKDFSGTINVQSTLGLGTTFYVTFPCISPKA